MEEHIKILLFGIFLIVSVWMSYLQLRKFGNTWVRGKVPKGWHIATQRKKSALSPWRDYNTFLFIREDHNTSIVIRKLKKEHSIPSEDPVKVLEGFLKQLKKDLRSDPDISWGNLNLTSQAKATTLNNQLPAAQSQYTLSGTPKGKGKTFQSSNTDTLVLTHQGPILISLSCGNAKSESIASHEYHAFLQTLQWPKAPLSKKKKWQIAIIFIVFCLLAAIAATFLQFS